MGGARQHVLTQLILYQYLVVRVGASSGSGGCVAQRTPCAHPRAARQGRASCDRRGTSARQGRNEAQPATLPFTARPRVCWADARPVPLCIFSVQWSPVLVERAVTRGLHVSVNEVLVVVTPWYHACALV